MIGYEKSLPYRDVQVEEEHATWRSLLHTLFHILGRYHEHQRGDREKYVHVFRQNIIEGIRFIVSYSKNRN